MVAILEFLAGCVVAIVCFSLIMMAYEKKSWHPRRNQPTTRAWFVYFAIIICSILLILLSGPRL